MHIVYLGVVSRPDTANKARELSVAGNKMQYNLLKYLSKYDDVKIDVVSFYPYKARKYSRKLFVKTTKEKLFDNVDVYQVGYVNLPIIKQLILPLKTYKLARRLTAREDIVMSYDMYPTQGIPMSKLRKKVDGKTICLLADLSIGGVQKLRGIKKWLRWIYDKNTLSNIKKCGHYIVLNENVVKTYIPNCKYMVMDGGIEPLEFTDKGYYWDGKQKNIIYTGALVDYSGIMNLIKAMDFVKNTDIVLDIYGDGPLKSKIEEIAKKDSRIRYYGKVDNQEAMKKQQTAWLLANPRPVDTLIAQVTFPSKIFEYLMSGRPVMTTRLNGFSKDYDDLLFWVDGSDAELLAAKINQIDRETDEKLCSVAENARSYLLQNKTWAINAKVLYRFLNEMF